MTMPLHSQRTIWPACSPKTLECLTLAIKDMVSLECLAWAMYNNILVPGPTPQVPDR